MAPEHKYTSLRDLLKDQAYQKPGFNRKPLSFQSKTDDSGDESDGYPLITEWFGELSFGESSNSSASLAELFSPPLPPPRPLPIDHLSADHHQNVDESDLDLNESPKLDKNEMKIVNKNFPEKNMCMYNNSVKLFPPPLTTLKMSRTGEPFAYYRFDKNANAFVSEEIMILPQGVMSVSREDGRLNLKFPHGFAECKEEEEVVAVAVTGATREKSEVEAEA